MVASPHLLPTASARIATMFAALSTPPTVLWRPALCIPVQEMDPLLSLEPSVPPAASCILIRPMNAETDRSLRSASARTAQHTAARHSLLRAATSPTPCTSVMLEPKRPLLQAKSARPGAALRLAQMLVFPQPPLTASVSMTRQSAVMPSTKTASLIRIHCLLVPLPEPIPAWY